jgi:hypothetical protein
MMMLGRFELVFDFLICILRAAAALGSFFSQTSLRAKGDAFFSGMACDCILAWHWGTAKNRLFFFEQNNNIT